MVFFYKKEFKKLTKTDINRNRIRNWDRNHFKIHNFVLLLTHFLQNDTMNPVYGSYPTNNKA